MNADAIEGGLTAIFRETFADPGMVLRPEMSAKTVPGWDSLKMVLIIMTVEERFGIQLRTAEMDGLRCVGDLTALIERRTATG